MFTSTESCGWHLVCCFMWRTAANIVGSTFCVQASEFGLAAMAELVVERPATILIGTANQFAKGVGMCGATSWLLLVLSACTCAWSRLALHTLGIWCLSGGKQVVCGRPVSNAVGEQELEKRAAVFRTSASFWEIGVHEWETNDVPSRATYTEKVKEPQWQASDFMVCARHEM